MRAIGLLLILLSTSAARAEPGVEYFEREIRPLLAAHCLECHSSRQKVPKSGLNLESRAAWQKGGERGAVIVPGKPAESLLLAAVRYATPGLKMPPRGKLAADEVARFEKWIAMGAPDPRTAAAATPRAEDLKSARTYWAYQLPRKHVPPPVKRTDWPRGDVDRFILAALEARGMAPGSDADRAILLRRLSLDLIGLPPTIEQMDTFLNDRGPDAWSAAIDRLLASPQFGEHWGRHWLDLARFADSSGGGRSLLFKDAWRFRDYVINAFNQDRPYDQFIREQIAGDLLPSSSPSAREQQLIATGFLALGPTNYERQDKDILESDVIDEQLDTIGRVFLGQTIGCARCHDHKFDPIPTRDYYALAGILRSTQSLIHDNVSRWVEQPLPMGPELAAVVKRHDAEVAALRERLRLAKIADGKSGTILPGVISIRDLPGMVLDDSQAKKVGNWTTSKYSGSYIGEGYLHDGNSYKGQRTLTFVPEFDRAGRYEVRLAYTPGGNRAARVPVTILHADGEQTFFVNQKEPPPIDGHFVSLGTFRFEKGNQWFVMVSNENTTGHVIVDAVQLVREDLKLARTAVPTAKSGSVKALEAELKKLQDSAPSRPVAMGVKDVSTPADFWICIRGNIHVRGPVVPRGFLEIATKGTVPTIPPSESGRRQLADWLVAPSNPLTARVIVNRVWHHLFGAGLVRTVDIYGTTGEPPSHPELLDHLATRFMEQGWSVKTLIRELVLSRTYQLASGRSPTADPENRLLSRANRRRLNAECLRDAILLAGDRLDPRRGGPAMSPDTTSEIGYKFDDRRRSVYLPVFRNQLPEIFEVFDFPDPNLVGGRRNVSTVASQALFMMNSPFVLEESTHAARRAIAWPGSEVERLERAYRGTLGRAPSDRERAVALRFIDAAASKQRGWERIFQALFACVDFRYVE